ncbi:MAG: S8 family serine peptidase [Alphaproteobacteria bacterium]|nr:S8 family serine peptidase [Alphaproteobacteria bacterium]
MLLEPPAPGVRWDLEPVPYLDDAPTGRWVAQEALDVTGAGAWHDAGYQGQGVKLAVFDLQWYGAELDELELGAFETHDCWLHEACTPEMDTLRPRFSWESGGHGMACAELVRDIAPGVELHLVRVNGQTSFRNAARWAVREGIDVVSLSMSFFNASFYDGTGPISSIVEEMSAGGVLLVTSSGNYADGHWLDTFRDVDGDGIHDFDGGSEYLPIWLEAGRRRGLSINWDNYGRCGDTDLDLYLYDQDGDLVGRATEAQEEGADRCSPVERLAPLLEEDQWTYLQVVRAAGDPDVRWNLIANAGSVWNSMPEYSVTDPGTHHQAFTVGAVRANGYAENGPEYFSSWGPNMAGALKPDIAAPDGVSTSYYAHTGFYGTSAAAPIAAAAVALVMSRYPELTPFEAAERLEGWADDDEAQVWQAHDLGLGAGRLRLANPTPPEGCGGGPPWRGAWIVIPLAGLGRRRHGGPR